MHHYEVPQKVMKNRSLWGKFGMTIFFRRYKLLESANFPWKTKSSLFFLTAASISLYVLVVSGPTAAVVLTESMTAVLVTSLTFFVCLSYLFTAPTIGRITPIRRTYLVIVHHVLCQFMESVEWCTGTNKTGYMMHLTARKLLEHEYVTEKELHESSTMAIVRNPYSRMVSIYNYNKFGSMESFPAFVRDWYNRMTKAYRERGELDEWYTPCHTIPQFEFTHSDGKQLIKSIIKQEELKLLKKKQDCNDPENQKKTSVSDLPDLVRKALLDMPRTNSRAKDGKKWYEYYDQETLDLVYEMYHKDFDVFEYNPILVQRHDLKAPKLYTKNQQPANECDQSGAEGRFINVPLSEGVVPEKDQERHLAASTMSSSSDDDDDADHTSASSSSSDSDDGRQSPTQSSKAKRYDSWKLGSFLLPRLLALDSSEDDSQDAGSSDRNEERNSMEQPEQILEV